MDRFSAHIRPYVPGCSDPWITRAVLDSAIRFCTASRIWQQKTTHTVLVGEDTISLTLPAESALEDVKVSESWRGRADYTLSGTTITFDDVFSTQTDITVTSFLKPSRDAVDLPDILHNDWFEGVFAGAIADLMLMSGKPWSNPAMASVNQTRYLYSVGQAALKSRTQNSQAGLVVKPRRFV